MNNKVLTEQDLTQFTGTGVWYRHSMVRGVLYTEGVQYMAEVGGAYWLIDEIALTQRMPKVKAEPFQLWTLAVSEQSAVLSCDGGNGKTVYQKKITFTDFPLPKIILYYTDNVILLPSEY